MEDIFISHIHINNLLHLKGLEIPLSATERKHLILTGRNGSGKTTLLSIIKNRLQSSQENPFQTSDPNKNQLEKQLIELENLKKQSSQLNVPLPEKRRLKYLQEDLIKQIKQREFWLNYPGSLNIEVTNKEFFQSAYKSNDLILAFFDSKKLAFFEDSAGVKKVEFKNYYFFDDRVNRNFVQHLVNLRYDGLDAKESNNQNEVKNIDIWFEKFTNALKDIFEDETLSLEFDRPNYNYNIILRGREKFDLNTLSDGYSAVMNILTELILRMEKKSSRFYDMQGIVLIDEIETHLHIDLQKKILPFLTAFFPKIQFIVTTHSPFVLTSIKNAVVYDLEKQEALTDLSGYSVEAIIESYFGQDKYANVLTEKVNQYEKLMSKNGLSETEREEKRDLKGYFKNLPYFLAPELQVKIQQIELAQLGK
jgi:predicted ATP-binding protein involved in virulence